MTLKTPVVLRPEYVITYEIMDTREVGRITFAHSEVFVPWTTKVRRQYASDLRQLMKLRNQPLFVLCNNKKLRKFIKLLGFRFRANLPGHPGMQIYIMEDPSWVK